MRSYLESGKPCALWTPSSPDNNNGKNDHKLDTACKYSDFLGVVDQNELVNLGRVLKVPRYALFGRQETREYDRSKTKLVTQRLDKCGLTCLEMNPPVVCALFSPDKTELVIIDGHHRVRTSGRYHDMNIIPARVATRGELLDFLWEHKIYQYYSGEMLERQLRRETIEAIVSFERAGMPEIKIPRPIYGVSNMDELSAFCQTFRTPQSTGPHL